jgi:GNAT superfamily N-acetyltransferase
MTGDPGDWLCVGDFCTGAAPLLGGSVAAAFALARTALPRRVIVDRWIRYRISLDSARTGPTDARLTPVTDDLVQALRQHPESAANQLKSGLRFWDHGLTRAYVWLNGSEPICIQWLLTSADSPRLRTLGEWAGMYPPLPADCGQVENLYAFSTVRKKGVATEFEYALFELTRQAGLRRLITHIHEGNVAARAWADRTGWQAYGIITRYRLDLPGLRGLNVFLHRRGDGGHPAS